MRGDEHGVTPRKCEGRACALNGGFRLSGDHTTRQGPLEERLLLRKLVLMLVEAAVVALVVGPLH